jgi:hypothetical protein
MGFVLITDLEVNCFVGGYGTYCVSSCGRKEWSGHLASVRRVGAWFTICRTLVSGWTDGRLSGEGY